MRSRWLAISLVLCSIACQQSGTDPTPRAFPIDTRPTVANEMPVAEGAGGFLGYADGCLFVTDYEGGRTGLVMPDSFRFDGQILTNGDVRFAIGEQVSFSGGFMSDSGNPERPYVCKTTAHVLVDNAFPSKTREP